MPSNDINKQKTPRKISIRDIKLKFKNNHWNLDFIPYIGPDFIQHSQKNNKSFNTFRNVLILDIGLEDNFNSVEEQAVNENCSFCLKNFINSLNDEINIKDLVYHCFLATKKIPQNKDSLCKYSVCLNKPIIFGKSVIYSEFNLNKKNIFGIKNDDLKLSAEILNEVILQAHPDIIFIFSNNLKDAINFSFFQTLNKSFNNYCSEANIKQVTINPSDWMNPNCEKEEINRTIQILQEEKKHRHNSNFNACLRTIKKLVKDAKEYAQEKKERYTNFFDFDWPNKHSHNDAIIGRKIKNTTNENNQLWKWMKTKDNLVDSLNIILHHLSTLNALKESLIDPDKQRYKPQREADERIGKGRRNRKKEE